jgi:hypothetical protein
MKRISVLGRFLALGSMITAVAQAGVLLDLSDALLVTDPTQNGRLSRNGIPQDWVGSELFPGVINTATTYQYRTYNIALTGAQFIQIDFDSNSVNTFVSAYQSSYLPNSAGAPDYGFDTNWLGDAGSSGNVFGNPAFFNVVAQPHSTLVVVVNETSGAGTGIGQTYRLTVEAFYDTAYNDTPEPYSMILCLSGFACLLARRAWKRA